MTKVRNEKAFLASLKRLHPLGLSTQCTQIAVHFALQHYYHVYKEQKIFSSCINANERLSE